VLCFVTVQEWTVWTYDFTFQFTLIISNDFSKKPFWNKLGKPDTTLIVHFLTQGLSQKIHGFQIRIIQSYSKRHIFIYNKSQLIFMMFFFFFMCFEHGDVTHNIVVIYVCTGFQPVCDYSEQRQKHILTWNPSNIQLDFYLQIFKACHRFVYIDKVVKP